MSTGRPGSHPVPETTIGVPRGPDEGEIVIEAIVGGAVVNDGVADGGAEADAVVDGLALRVAGECDVRWGVGDTENDGVAIGPGVVESASG